MNFDFSIIVVFFVLFCFLFLQICIKGKVHIFKYLSIEACRSEKMPDSLYLPVIERLGLRPSTGRSVTMVTLVLHHKLTKVSCNLSCAAVPFPTFVFLTIISVKMFHYTGLRYYEGILRPLGGGCFNLAAPFPGASINKVLF